MSDPKRPLNIIAQSMQLKAGRTAQEYCDRLRAYVVFA
jgi:hypothetical protein